VISVVHLPLISLVVRPCFNQCIDFVNSVFAEFEPIENCTLRVSVAAVFRNFAQNHTLPRVVWSNEDGNGRLV